MLPGSGEDNFQYLLVVRLFNWGVTEYSNYRVFGSICGSIGLVVFMPMFHFCHVTDITIIGLATILLMASRVILGLATDAWMFYLAALVDLLQSCFSPAIRAIMSKCVTPEEIGKIFAILSSAESLVPIISSLIYSNVYLAFADTDYPGAPYFLSVGILSVNLILSM